MRKIRIGFRLFGKIIFVFHGIAELFRNQTFREIPDVINAKTQIVRVTKTPVKKQGIPVEQQFLLSVFFNY